jgi:hypothetical protein
MNVYNIARSALQELRRKIRWKPNKAVEHLRRRIMRGHLPPGTTIEQYEEIIAAVVSDQNAELYIFDWRGVPYPTVVTRFDGQSWLVMLSAEGIMETAFVVDVEGYLDNPAYTRLGTMKELGI